MKKHIVDFIDAFNNCIDLNELLINGFDSSGMLTETQKNEIEFELVTETKKEIKNGVLITKIEFEIYLDEFTCDFETFHLHYSQLYIIINEPCSYR